VNPFSVLKAAAEAPDRIALIDDDGTRTFRELADEVVPLLEPLRALGPGARVALSPERDSRSIVRLLAAIEAQVPVVLLHPGWSSFERERAIALTEPAVHLEELAPSDDARTHEASGDPTRALALIFTSGSTGAPRAAVLSQGALFAACEASADALGWLHDDRWMLAMPLAHVGGLSIVLRCVAARRTIVLHRGALDATALQATAARHRCTLVSLVPTVLRRWLAGPDVPIPSLRAMLIGGASCPEALLTRAIASGLPIRTTYGLTEMCAQVATLRSSAERADIGVGPPLKNVEVSIEDERVLVRGPSLFDGFWREPSPLDARGFYDTGDHGRWDEAGNLHVLGRRTDLIVSGGENVYPAEVEGALEAIEGIATACVFGSPDPEWGEVVCALCIATAPPSVECLRTALSERIAAFKRPRRIAFVASLPTLPSGKADRRAAAALFSGMADHTHV
jgi:O-succinylbenzoic acid--CoA ligase